VADGFVIETADLRKTYDGVEALRGLNLQVPAGSICGFLGRNGAGKTTTIKVLLGMARPASGQARQADVAEAQRPQRLARLLRGGGNVEAGSSSRDSRSGSLERLN
jgi:ABC-2 type transport system ATP-binding protein